MTRAAPSLEYLAGLPTPPAAPEIEQALLAAVIADPRQYERVCDVVRPEHFGDPRHVAIWTVLQELGDRGRFEPQQVMARFREGGEVEPRYVADIAGAAVSTIAAPDYAATVKDRWLRRQMWVALNEGMEDACNDLARSAADHLEEAERRLYELAERDRPMDLVPAAQAVAETVLRIEEAAKRKGQIAGLPTGLELIDEALGGMEPGNLIVLAGRPGMGKSDLALNVARNVGRSGGRVAFFSLEMSAVECMARFVAMYTGVCVNDQRRGLVDMRALAEAQGAIGQLPVYIDQTPAARLSHIRTRARRMKRRYGLDLIVVDHLQRMGVENPRSNRYEHITETSAGLKDLAKELGVPVMMLSQLSRAVENRDDKRPQMADLRESGSIEQDADAILFLYRESYYLERSKPDAADHDKYLKWTNAVCAAENKAEVIIGKSRFGKTGTATVFYAPARSRFGNLAGGDAQ